MNACLNILALCFLVSLSACSTFYNRHYTKGIFYEGFAHRTQPDKTPAKPTPMLNREQLPDSTHMIAHNDSGKEKIAQPERTQHAAIPENIKPLGTKKFTGGNLMPSPVLRKALKPVHRKVQAYSHSDSIVSKAAFYILALILAVGIIALAIYFLPAIMIPAAATSAFSTILLIGAIVVVCVFAFLIYTLIHSLIELFRRKKTPEDPELQDF